MPDAPTYPKRLIEVDLPIRRISAHARREKSIRHGHISTLHIWWARRPLAACRAVICAALWPDPADPLCPDNFREAARKEMRAWATTHMKLLSPESYPRFNAIARDPRRLDDPLELRKALLDFIADFANWDNSTVTEYLETSRTLTQAAHESLAGEPGTRPLVADPFAGGGAIPLEALRVGAEAFASDLNPIAVILNRVILEHIPKYGSQAINVTDESGKRRRLAGLGEVVRHWGTWVQEEAERRLSSYYPHDPNGSVPIAYLWARTIQCEGPGCGVEVPLIRSLWLSRGQKTGVALRLVPNVPGKRVDVEILNDPQIVGAAEGTVKRGSAVCPLCKYTTPVKAVRKQLSMRRGGASTARLLAVVTAVPGTTGRAFRLPEERDRAAIRLAVKEYERKAKELIAPQLPTLPDEAISLQGTHRIIKMLIYGARSWSDLFTPRQLVTLATFASLVREVGHKIRSENGRDLACAVQTLLALVLGRVADRCSALCRYDPSPTMSGINNTFSRQALPIVWDFAEGDPLGNRSGGWGQCLNWLTMVLERENQAGLKPGTVDLADAGNHPLPDDSVDCLVTDPPYYSAIAYAALSDFFYVWQKRAGREAEPRLLADSIVNRDAEIIVDMHHEKNSSNKTVAFYESRLTEAFSEARRVLRPDGIGAIVFASKTTASWEAILQAVLDAGWTISASWPIDTEMENKVAAIGQARLMSSVHLVCRPRENADGSLRTGDVGDWREVLGELPRRIHEWMPRLADEGVVGADAIFACLGPALEIYSRYSRVERTSGDAVTLKEYLVHVWAAVSKEALSMIFRDADTSGLEPDARLTAMWLWTLAGPVGTEADPMVTLDKEIVDEDEDEETAPKARNTGFALEFDAARKIAQGLGARLEELTTVVEVKGDTARLLPVAERTKALFAKAERTAAAARKKGSKQKQKQMNLFEEEIGQAAEEQGWDAVGAPEAGKTTLDRVHQAMLLFGTGRGEALKRFLVEEGVGRQAPFWKLAQALSALYPAGCDEKRWVDGVLARKKGLGF